MVIRTIRVPLAIAVGSTPEGRPAAATGIGVGGADIECLDSQTAEDTYRRSSSDSDDLLHSDCPKTRRTVLPVMPYLRLC